MNKLSRLFCAGFLILLGAVLDLHGQAVLSAAAEQDPALEIHVNVKQGLLTIDVRDAPLADVLHAVEKHAGIDVIIAGDLGTRVTQSLKAVSLEEGIRRLLHRHSMALVYSPSPNKLEDQTLTGVWVIESLPAEPNRRRVAVANLNERAIRLQAIRALSRQRGEPRISELIRFSQDPDPFVRRQAIVVLGRLGGRDAVAALKMALRDQAASIRIQALRALRRLEGDRAAPTLGVILLHDPDARVRRMAARALAQLRSEEARWALEAAVTDPEASVRQAVAKWQR